MGSTVTKVARFHMEYLITEQIKQKNQGFKIARESVTNNERREYIFSIDFVFYIYFFLFSNSVTIKQMP